MKKIFILASTLAIISITYTADNASQEIKPLRFSRIRVKPLFKHPGLEYTEGEAFEVQVNFDSNGDTWRTLIDKINNHENAWDECRLRGLVVSSRLKSFVPLSHLNYSAKKHLDTSLSSTIGSLLEHLNADELLELNARFNCDGPKDYFIKGH